MNSTLTLTQEWDKTFPQNEAVDHCKVTFHNRFGIELAADLYKPKGAQGPFAAVAVSGPFGAVKEQCSGLYAQELAARGFLTVAFDPSYTGESGGTPRYVASPDINTEDFSAAVDFLSVRDDVDPERIGILGICGWGGMALNAAAIDTRIKATVTSTMYDMTRVTANGYFDTDDNPDARYALRQALNTQRTADYKAGTYQRAGGVVDPVPDDAPFFVKDYHDYYKTPRGYHPRSLNSTGGWNVTSPLSLLNAKLLAYAGEIRSAVLMIHGDKAHSCYFSRDAFTRLQGDNKELLLKLRSIVTITALISKGITDSSLTYHLTTAKQNGVTKTEMAELLTHLAFYAGWPNAWAAFRQAKEVYADESADANGGLFGLGAPNTAYAQYFTGESFLNPLTDPTKTVFLANVTFSPACRNNWHIHHAKSGGGQLLLCTDGLGWYQEAGKRAQALHPGDVVTIPAEVKHWHGAQKDCWFSHIAIECPGEETSNEWLEPVTDAEYAALDADCAQNP